MESALRVALLALLGLSLLPLASSGALSWEALVRLLVVIAGIGWLVRSGFGRDGEGETKLAMVFPLVFAFIVAEFCREAVDPGDGVLSVVRWVAWVVVGIGLAAVSWYGFRDRNPARKRQICQLTFVDKLVLGALGSLQVVYGVAIWDGWASGSDALVLVLAAGAYLLASRFFRTELRIYSTWVLWTCIISFGVVILGGVWKAKSIQSLQEVAREHMRAGAYEVAIGDYTAVVTSNAMSIGLDRFELPPILNDISSDLETPEEIKAFVGGKVLEPSALSYEEWENVLSLYRIALAGGEEKGDTWRRDCRRGIGVALVYLQRWEELVRNSELSIQEDPEWLPGWIQIGVGQIKLARYEAALVPFWHVVEKIAENKDGGGSGAHPQRIWTIEKLVELLPESARPYVWACSYEDVTAFLRQTDYSVLHEAEEIGRTGIRPPVSMRVLSAGLGQGSAAVVVDGKVVEGWNPQPRGYNLVVVNPENGVVERWSQFDTFLDKEGSIQMLEWVEDVPDGWIVVGTVYDEASNRLAREGVKALRKIGSQEDLRGKYRWAHAIIGIKGGEPGSALEVTDSRRAALSVIVGNIPVEFHGLGGVRLLEKLEEMHRTTNRRIIYLSGVDKEDEVVVIGADSSI
jgi:hypothetical protein